MDVLAEEEIASLKGLEKELNDNLRVLTDAAT
jgi:hypothetical protein